MRLSFILPMAALFVLPSVLPAQPEPAKSLFFVAATSQSARFLQPWEKNQPQRKRGMGALIPGNRVLVTAELTVDSTYIELERPGDGIKATARVTARDYECNLAVVEPIKDAAKFFEGAVPLEIDTPAKAGDELEVWQLEDDGSPIVTKGNLLRVELGSYFLPDRSFLRYEFKASLQNKAGSFIIPAVRGGKLTGILLGYNSDDQIADILPAPIMRKFLDDAADGTYQGFATIGVRYARTTDTQFRQWLGLPDDVGGIYLSKVVKKASADAAGLQEGDVILAMDGFDIDRRGYYKDPDFGPLNFGHLITGRKNVGETLKVTVWRDKKKVEVPVKLMRQNAEDFLVDPWMFDRGPRYLVAGGLVFTELTRPFIRSFRDWEKNAPVSLRHIELNPEQYSEGRQKVVILAYMIPTKANIGYERITTTVVEEVNGKKIGSIRDLNKALLSPVKGVHEIKVTAPDPVIYIDSALAAEVDEQLMAKGLKPLSRLD